jgi:hypothetical protein
MIPWQVLKEEWLKPIGGFLVFPYFVYKEIKDQVDLWKTKTHTPRAGKVGDARALKPLIARVNRYKEEAPVLRDRLCQGIISKLFTDPSLPIAQASKKLLAEIIWYEGLLRVPELDLTDTNPSTSKVWEMEDGLSRIVDSFEKTEALEERLEKLVRAILEGSDLAERQAKREGEAMFSVPLYTLLPKPILSVERILGQIVTERWPDSPFKRLWRQLKENMFVVSGIDPSDPGDREPVWPSKAKMQATDVIESYLGNTPSASFFASSLPFDVF